MRARCQRDCLPPGRGVEPEQTVGSRWSGSFTGSQPVAIEGQPGGEQFDPVGPAMAFAASGRWLTAKGHSGGRVPASAANESTSGRCPSAKTSERIVAPLTLAVSPDSAMIFPQPDILLLCRPHFVRHLCRFPQRDLLGFGAIRPDTVSKYSQRQPFGQCRTQFAARAISCGCGNLFGGENLPPVSAPPD